MRWLWVLALLMAGALARAEPALRFVGSAACASCHAKEAQAWQSSQHQRAMQPAARPGILAPFKGERFSGATFSERQGRFFVNTDGPDGKLRDYEIAAVLGIAPLQQYLAKLPDGSLHALPQAWDTRPKAEGGQRWFRLTPAVPPTDELHWTGRQANANFMCIECHTTGFAKNYDPPVRRYASRWAEGNVACEACHGAGSAHVDWARRGAPAGELSKGLQILFDQRRGAQWRIDPVSGNARRTPEMQAQAHSTKEADVCARCHAHRSRIGEDAGPGTPPGDAFHLSLVEPGLYWNDGQMRAEVYNHAGFLQSRMHAKGVTCSDCHEPHTQQLRAPGNAVCLQCHAAPKYEAPTHHFHKLGSTGAQCINCHMPASTFMAIDRRHDHFIRVPQPAQSQRSGSPDACTQCHRDKPQSWAVQWTQRWYPHLEERASKMAAALNALDHEDMDVVARLSAVIGDAKESPVARASVLARLPAGLAGAALPSLADPDPLVRRAAATALRDADASTRARLLVPLLDDPVRDVRLEAARWLADQRPPGPRLTRVLDEYVAAQQLNADRPEAWDNLGTLWADRGQPARAETAFREALSLAPGFAASTLNLADLIRLQPAREPEAQALLEALVRREPRLAAARFALGLSLLRQHRLAEALVPLKAARELAPEDARIKAAYEAALLTVSRTPRR